MTYPQHAQRLRRDLENLRRARVGPHTEPGGCAGATERQGRAARGTARRSRRRARARVRPGVCTRRLTCRAPSGLHPARSVHRSICTSSAHSSRGSKARSCCRLGVTARDVFITIFRPGDVLSHMGNTHVMLEESGRCMRDNLVPGEYRIEARTRVPNPSMGGGWISVPGPRRPDEPSASIPRVWASADVLRLLDERDEAQAAAAAGTTQDVEPERAPHQIGPALTTYPALRGVQGSGRTRLVQAIAGRRILTRWWARHDLRPPGPRGRRSTGSG
jgi:hypothetical protein